VVSQVYSFVRPFRSVNTYGLFSVMTKTRPEIIFELSTDGKDWEELKFKWKPVRLNETPGWIQPHQPRLDWQLWFAGLYYEQVLNVFQGMYGRIPESYDEIHHFIYGNLRQTYHQHVWVHKLMESILYESPPVLKLISTEEWPTGRTTIRAWLYDYRFTRNNSTNWWVRNNKRLLFPSFRVD
jgi:hypothetical protein